MANMHTTDPPPSATPYRPEYADEVHNLCLLGDMDEDAIALALQVSPETLRHWQATVPAFAEEMRRAGKLADGAAARGLHRRATGCSNPEVRIFMPAGTPEPVYARYDRHLPPHPASAIKWLEARHRQVWRTTGETKAPLTNDIEKLKQCTSDELWAIVARELAKHTAGPPGDPG